MTIPPLVPGSIGRSAMRTPTLTGAINAGVPPLVGDSRTPIDPARPVAPLNPASDAPIALGGRLDAGGQLPEITALALALEKATRAMGAGRADLVLSVLDPVWSDRLGSDSPWYLRTAALQLLGRTNDAEQVMRDAIERLPRSAAMLYLLGVHSTCRGQLDAARLANDHALMQHPNEPLLLLQRAALMQASDSPLSLAPLLEQICTLAPSMPITQWFTTLGSLGRTRTRQPTPAASMALARLTPHSMVAISEQGLAVAPSQVPLEAAVRYGLTLLDSPTQSARAATGSTSRVDPDVRYSQAMTAQQAAAQRSPADVPQFPHWDTLLLAAGLMAVLAVPAMRAPAIVFTGVAALVMIVRRVK
jgi:tetratricopeptide (TPR) repeat protein